MLGDVVIARSPPQADDVAISLVPLRTHRARHPSLGDPLEDRGQ